METSVNKVTEDVQVTPADICLPETEEQNTDSDSGSCSKSKKRRIVYDKDFLVECFHLPASSKKPPEFPVSNLECTLGVPRLGKNPFSIPYVPPKRKEENGKKEKEPEDNISLRPHSGNFSSGCAPNLSPAHVPHNAYARFQVHEDQSKNTFERSDRDFPRNNFRFTNNNRLDMNERNRVDRERDRERDRDRERESSVRNNRVPNRRPNSHTSWGADVEQSEWGRRRNNNGSGRDDGKQPRRGYYDRERPSKDEDEPEWFSGGPTSQHETIELRGFLDDDRRDKPKEKSNASVPVISKSVDEANNSTIHNSNNSGKINDDARSKSSKDMDFNIEKILKMDHIPGILPNGLLEDEEPSGSSRFSQFFQKNSSAHISTDDNSNTASKSQGGAGPARDGLAHLFQKPVDVEEKSKVIQEMEVALRNILLTNNKEQKSNESDMDAFKKLLAQVVKGNNKSGSVEETQESLPARPVVGPPPGLATQSSGLVNTSNAGSQSSRNHHSHSEPFADLLKPQHHHINMSHKFPVAAVDRHQPHYSSVNQPGRNSGHSLGDQLKKQRQNILSPAQLMTLLPPDVQHLVANTSLDYDFVMRPEVSKIVNALTNGEIAMGDIIEQLAAPHSPHRLILVGIVKLCLHGVFTLPNLTIHPPVPRSSNVIPGILSQPGPRPFQKGMDDSREHLTKRSGTPVASMSFTPTSVMRKMTGEQQIKVTVPTASVKPSIFTSPSSTQASNQHNLATVMTAMAQQAQVHSHPHQHPSFHHPRSHYPVVLGPAPPPGMPLQHMANHQFMNYPHQISNVMGAQSEMGHKNKLSDDLVKLLSSGVGFGEGSRTNSAPHPLALSLEEVEQMQLRASNKYQ